jgi:hypothetical protein
MSTVPISPTHRSSPRPRPAEVAYLIVAPVLATWLLGISLIDQQSFVDPEFYTGYAQSFERMWRMFGLTYYVARFPVMFVNRVAQELLPGMPGYVMVRALVFAASAAPLYALVRERCGRTPALVAYSFLFLNPLFPRILCWDLTTFLSIPMGLAGISLWMLARAPLSWATFGAGFAFGVSVSCHIFTGTAIGVFLAVESLFALHSRQALARLMKAAAVATAGALTTVGLGLLFYRLTIGYIPPGDLWQVTRTAITFGQRFAENNYVAFGDYYASSYEIYVPVIVTLALVTLNARGLFRDTFEARVTWFATAYLAAYVVAVFVLRMNIVQYFWYFGHLTIAVYLGVPVLVSRLSQKVGGVAGGAFAASLALVALFAAAAFTRVWSLAHQVSGHGFVVVAILVAGVLAIVLVFLPLPAMRIAGTVLLAITLQAPYLSRTHLDVYDRHANAAEVPLFDVIRAYHAVLNRYDEKDRRVRSWYPTPNPTALSVGSSNLLFTVQEPWAGPGLPVIGTTEMTNLNRPDTGYVLMFSANESDVEAGLSRLTSAGIHYSLLERQVWGRAPVAMNAALVRLER